MRFIHRLIRTLTLPGNAGPDDSAIIIGPDIPDELTAYYATSAPVTGTVIGCIIFRQDADDYAYLALVDAFGPPGQASFLAFGTSEGAGGNVLETQRMEFASSIGNAGQLIFSANAEAHVEEDSVLHIDALGFFTVAASGIVNFLGGSSVDFGAGSLVRYDNESIVGTTSFTPTWTQSTTDPTLNNGTLIGHYRKTGNLVWFLIRLTIGSLTTMGTGDFGFTLPIDPNLENQPAYAIAIDNSAGTAFPCMSRLRAAAPEVFRIHVPTGGRVTETAPFTWASGDVLSISGTYRSA